MMIENKSVIYWEVPFCTLTHLSGLSCSGLMWVRLQARMQRCLSGGLACGCGAGPTPARRWLRWCPA